MAYTRICLIRVSYAHLSNIHIDYVLILKAFPLFSANLCGEKVLATKNLIGTDRNTVRSDQDKTKMEFKFGLPFCICVRINLCIVNLTPNRLLFL